MKIFYDKDKSMELMQRIEQKFGGEVKRTARGEEMHVYDLTNCFLKAYCRLTGIERKPTKSNVGLMVFGIVSEHVLAWTYPRDVCQYMTHIPFIKEEENIYGHIDIYENKQFPLEIKGSRKNIFKSVDLPIQWVEQLMSYMAMEGQKKGWLIIYNVFSCQIMAFQIQMTPQDIIDWVITLSRRTSNIKIAVSERKPEMLAINPLEYENCDYKTICPRNRECYDKWKVIKTKKQQAKREKEQSKSPFD